MQYHVWGKTVTIKKLEWAADIAEPYGNRVHVLGGWCVILRTA